MTHCPRCFRVRHNPAFHICLAAPARAYASPSPTQGTVARPVPGACPFPARHGAQREAATRGSASGRSALTAHETPALGPSRFWSTLWLGQLLEQLGGPWRQP